jgi:hypothetical protein
MNLKDPFLHESEGSEDPNQMLSHEDDESERPNSSDVWFSWLKRSNQVHEEWFMNLVSLLIHKILCR